MRAIDGLETALARFNAEALNRLDDSAPSGMAKVAEDIARRLSPRRALAGTPSFDERQLEALRRFRDSATAPDFRTLRLVCRGCTHYIAEDRFVLLGDSAALNALLDSDMGIHLPRRPGMVEVMMALPRFLGGRDRGAPVRCYRWEAKPAGLYFSPALATDAHLTAVAAILSSPEVGALLDQLVTADLAGTTDDAAVMDWEQVHELVRSPAYASILPLLELPPALPILPRLQSRGSLTDPHFAIGISGWAASDGIAVAIQALAGSIVKTGDRLGLLPAPVWRLLSALNAFSDRPVDQRAPALTRRHWGTIRRLAVEAGALLDEFLVRSVVVTPEKLDVQFRKTRVAGSAVVEISPGFNGAPERWLEFFDKTPSVPEHFNIPTEAGAVHVALSEPVRSVLSEIKRLPGRRTAGARAEAFMLNPLAAVGEHAAEAIDPEQFAEARKSAGIEFDQFFEPGSLRVMTAYGDALASLRVPRASVDADLQQQGLVRFLRPDWRGSAQLVLTTYETLRDLEFSFAKEPWSILVCDEAQKIKNPNALVTRAVKKLNVRFRVACTGTPVENSLTDLWCLFDMVQPGLLGALNEFGREYGRIIESGSDRASMQLEKLRAMIDPQVIRRTKADVAKDLPRKIAVPDCRLEMSNEQRAHYVGAIQRFHGQGSNDDEARLHHLASLQYLRLVCADPRPYGACEYTGSAARRRRA